MTGSPIGNSMAALLAAAMHLGMVSAGVADGAVAVGTTGDVVRHGIAFGMVVDVPADTAATAALGRCRTFQAREAAKACKVVATFSRECYAIAYDPQPGTPGAGWGIGRDQEAANGRAMAMCEQTAGVGRQGSCRVESAGCDTRN